MKSKKWLKVLLVLIWSLSLSALAFHVEASEGRSLGRDIDLFEESLQRAPGQSAAQENNTHGNLASVLKQLAESPIGQVFTSILTSQFSNWGIDPNVVSSINIVEAWKNFLAPKREVVVAVIDTGIDPNHPFLADNLHVTNGKLSATKNFGKDFSKGRANENTPIDTHGHGTHVAGIIKSVFPQVRILTLKYYNPTASGQDNLNSTIAALRFAVEQNVDIINYSGGGPEPSDEELAILKEAERKGILVIAAAGNEQNNIDDRSKAYYPASYNLSNIISVAAHDQNLRKLASSNFGAQSVHISAPGHRVRSSLPQERAGYLTGTSQATAFVSGVAALLMAQFPSLNAAQIKSVITQSARPEGTLQGLVQTGGRLDAANAQSFALKLSPSTEESTPTPTPARDLANRNPNSQGQIIYLRSQKSEATEKSFEDKVREYLQTAH